MADIGIRVIMTGLAEFRRNAGAAQSDINSLNRTIQTVSGTTSALGQSMTRVGMSMVGLGRTMSIFVTAPIVAAGVAAVEAGIKFESSFAGIGKTVEGVMTTTGQLTELGQEIRDEFRQMALEIPIATNELNHLGEVVGQLGIQADDVAEVTELVAMLGATTELSAEEAATGLIKFGNIMGVTTDQFEDFIRRAGSAVVALGNSSVSTEGEILNLSLRLAAAGDRANFSSQEILAWATTLTDLGVRAEMGGTAVSRAITEMVFAVQTGGEGIAEFAHISGMGIEQFRRAFEEDASGALLNFIGNLEEGIRTGRVTEEMLRNMGLSGVRAIDVMGRLGDAAGIFEKNLDTANTEWERQLALQEEFNKRAATVESQIQILKNQFTDLGITIFDLVRDDLVRLVEFIGNLIEGFKTLDPNVQKAILVFGLVVAAIGPLLVIIGGLIAAIGTIITAFAALTPTGLLIGGLVALGAALLAAFSPAILSAIQNVSGALSTLTAPKIPEGEEPKTFKEEPTGIKPLKDIGDSFSGLVNMVTFAVEEVKKILGPPLTELFTNLGIAVSDLGITWTDVWGQIIFTLNIAAVSIGALILGLIIVVSVMVSGVIGSLNFLLTAGGGLLDSFGMIFSGIKRLISGDLSGIIEIIMGFVAATVNLFLFLGGALIASVLSTASAVLYWLGFPGAAEALTAFKDEATRIVTELTQGIIDLFQALFDRLVGGSLIPELVDLALAKFTEFKDTAISVITEMVTAITGKFTAMREDLVSSIDVIIGKALQLSSGFQSFLNWLNTNANRIMEWLFKIASAAASIPALSFGSPQLKIYYGFRDFFDMMNARAMDAIAPMSQMANLSAMMATVPAPVSTSNVSNVDRSVNVDGINLTKNEQGMMYELLYSRQQARNR